MDEFLPNNEHFQPPNMISLIKYSNVLQVGYYYFYCYCYYYRY